MGGLPSWLKQYNAKPVLIQKSGALHAGADFLEMDVDIRGWSYPSKSGLYTLLPSFKDILVEIGFVIEGRDDDEMPEAMLGCNLMNIDMAKIGALVGGANEKSDATKASS